MLHRININCARHIRWSPTPTPPSSWRSIEFGHRPWKKHTTRYASVTGSPLSISTSSPSFIPPNITNAPRHIPPPSRPRRILRLVNTILIIIAGGYILLLPLWQDTQPPSPLHPTIFQPWVLVAREPGADPLTGASARSAIFTFRPQGDQSGKNIRGNGKGENNTRAWDSFWARGVWSVEVKQPELMVSRRYTPLPCLERIVLPEVDTVVGKENSAPVEDEGQGEDGGERGGELRLLIKFEPGGEVSRWLFGLPVGSTVWFRGPRWEWEYPWYGRASRPAESDDRASSDKGKTTVEGIKGKDKEIVDRAIVFLAGGTGIAPALQVGASFFEEENRQSLGLNHQSQPKEPACLQPNTDSPTPISMSPQFTPQPHQPAPAPLHTQKTDYTILWAVRTPHDIPHQIASNISTLTRLAELQQQQRPPGQIYIKAIAHPDSHSKFITSEDIGRALSPSTKFPLATSSSPSRLVPQKSWFFSWLRYPSHSTPQLQKGETGTDAPSSSVKRLNPSEKYIFASGPEGFIMHFTGSKDPDGQSQGKVDGVVKEVVRRGRVAERGSGGNSDSGKGGDEDDIARTRWFVWKF